MNKKYFLAAMYLRLSRDDSDVGGEMCIRDRSEIGPRALCHRSILANATWDGMKDYINKKVKHRENFRPFAPVIMEEFEQQYFNIKQDSPYMLLAPTVMPEYAPLIPSVVHVDQTARVQSVNKENNPFIYELIKNFYELSGIPVLLNTSFNEDVYKRQDQPEDIYQSI